MHEVNWDACNGLIVWGHTLNLLLKISYHNFLLSNLIAIISNINAIFESVDISIENKSYSRILRR